MTPELHQRIVNRLIESGDGDEPWALIVLAAIEGEEDVKALLDGVREVAVPAIASVPAAAMAEPPGAYISSIEVEGFRGVGSAAKLSLRPGPGLTLVVGRNGSGKSSFAEGLEYLLTGCNYRWEGRPKAWVAGWHNLHHDRVALKAELLVEGEGALSVSRTWNTKELAGHDVRCSGVGKTPQTLKSLGWDEALETFRPFLSYNELGTLLEDGPSTLYDALSNVLGLEELATVQARLASSRKERQTLWDETNAGAAALKAGIDRAIGAGISDTRLQVARDALKAASWDVTALDGLVRAESTHDSGQFEMLRRIESLARIDVEGVGRSVEKLRSTAKTATDLAGSDADRSRERADLLDQALQFHEKHQDQRCPVCGTASGLGGNWETETRDAIRQLRAEAAACQAAVDGVKASVREAHRLVSAKPQFLPQSNTPGMSVLPELNRVWEEWAAGREIDSQLALADHLEGRALELADLIQKAIDEASAERASREDVWRPIATEIEAWVPKARRALAAKEHVKQVKAAEAWWKDATATLRDERFAPIAERAKAIWNQLRLQSNVDLAGVLMEGTAQRRRVTLEVKVDGKPAEALGVMSQGELHSLALSLFLPRATLPESPFRFICIDDPVQSMDPARVAGLARTLAETALTRQVIVFTHDDRLPEAVRRLGLKATVHRVTRRAESVVEVERIADPVSSLMEDARAVAMTDNLPPAVASRVVPGFCRAAVEAACMETVRRRRLSRGEPHEAVERVLTENAKTHPMMALALFDDETRGNDVLARLQKLGPWAVEAFKTCKLGAHELHEGDLMSLIDNSKRLARQLLELQ